MSIFYMTLLSQYSVLKEIKVNFSQNVIYHMKDDFFVVVENSKSKKNDFSWVFTERVTFL